MPKLVITIRICKRRTLNLLLLWVWLQPERTGVKDWVVKPELPTAKPWELSVSSEGSGILFFFFFNVYLFVLRERESVQGRGRERGRERKSLAVFTLSAQSPTWGSNP